MGSTTHNVTAFPYRAADITPSDSTTFTEPATVYVGSDGNVAVVPWSGDGSAVTFVGLTAGQTVPVLVKKVMSTNTTASNLVRVY